MYEMVAPEDETQPRNRLGHSKVDGSTGSSFSSSSLSKLIAAFIPSPSGKSLTTCL